MAWDRKKHPLDGKRHLLDGKRLPFFLKMNNKKQRRAQPPYPMLLKSLPQHLPLWCLLPLVIFPLPWSLEASLSMYGSEPQPLLQKFPAHFWKRRPKGSFFPNGHLLVTSRRSRYEDRSKGPCKGFSNGCALSYLKSPSRKLCGPGSRK